MKYGILKVYGRDTEPGNIFYSSLAVGADGKPLAFSDPEPAVRSIMSGSIKLGNGGPDMLRVAEITDKGESHYLSGAPLERVIAAFRQARYESRLTTG